MNIERDLLDAIEQAAERNNGMTPGFMIPGIVIEDDPEEKVYLVLLSITSVDRSDEERDWNIYIGRQYAYDSLKTLITTEAIDPNKSFIIPASHDEDGKNVFFDGRFITVFRFMKAMKLSNKVLDDGIGFDIDEYNPRNQNGDYTILEV